MYSLPRCPPPPPSFSSHYCYTMAWPSLTWPFCQKCHCGAWLHLNTWKTTCIQIYLDNFHYRYCNSLFIHILQLIILSTKTSPNNVQIVVLLKKKKKKRTEVAKKNLMLKLMFKMNKWLQLIAIRWMLEYLLTCKFPSFWGIKDKGIFEHWMQFDLYVRGRATRSFEQHEL